MKNFFLICRHLVAFIFKCSFLLTRLESKVYDLFLYNTQQTDYEISAPYVRASRNVFIAYFRNKFFWIRVGNYDF